MLFTQIIALTHLLISPPLLCAQEASFGTQSIKTVDQIKSERKEALRFRAQLTNVIQKMAPRSRLQVRQPWAKDHVQVRKEILANPNTSQHCKKDPACVGSLVQLALVEKNDAYASYLATRLCVLERTKGRVGGKATKECNQKFKGKAEVAREFIQSDGKLQRSSRQIVAFHRMKDGPAPSPSTPELTIQQSTQLVTNEPAETSGLSAH